MMFTCCPNLMFLVLRDWRYIDFQTGYFADFEQFKVDIYFANFGQVRIDPIFFLFLTLDRSKLFYWQLESRTCFLNKWALKVQSSISFCNTFFWFLWQNKLCLIRIKTQKILDKWGLNGYFFWQYCQERYLEPNQKSMVELFCKHS